VDQAKVEFLFGQAPEFGDPDDPEVRSVLLSEQFEDDDEMTPGRLALFEVAANQVANDDPPEVWETAQRLLGLGLDRELVLRQLVLAMVPQVWAAIAKHEPYDRAVHQAALAGLPVPSPDEIISAFSPVVRERQPIAIDELVALTAAALDIPAHQEPHWTFLRHVLDQSVEDEDLAVVMGELVVEPSSLCARAVFTHRLTAEELDGDYLEIDVDLVGAEEAVEVHGPGGAKLEDFWREDVGLAWKGPAGWLARFPVGTVFAARSNEDGTARFVDAIALPPAADEAAATAVRAAYDECTNEVELPVTIKDLVLTLLAKDGHFFDEARPPVRELVTAAGLERRDEELAHSPELWRNADEADQRYRVVSSLDRPEEADAALSVLAVFNDGDWSDAKRMREALTVLRDDPDIADVVAGELLGPELREGPEISTQAALASRFAERLLVAARKDAEVAVARWLMALADERAGDVFGAEAQLRIAVETFDDWEPAVDRLAWYLSDRGEADEAARLWRSLGVEEDDPRLTDLEITAGPSVPRPGRNDPCWCGSGRKYKTCHLGKPFLAPLPDRVRWLAAKSVNYLKHVGQPAAPDIISIAAARAGGDMSPEGIAKAFSDPLTLDLVLNEGGWFEKFLQDRGPLLPGDEALLAAAWALVDRSVYEILSVRPGADMTVKDLRTAEEIEVRERKFSKHAAPGQLVCTRAVPDGQGNQFLGGLFYVRPGTEATLLDLLDEGDPEAIAAWAAALDRPPVLRTREDEATVMCKAVIEVPDELQARRALNRHYRHNEAGTWEDLFEMAPDDLVLRATLHLDGSRLSVETNSEERMDRVLGVLKKEMPDMKILGDERAPLDLSKARSSSGLRVVGDNEGKGPGGDAAREGGASPGGGGAVEGGAAGELITLPPEVREQIQDRFERRWCDEQVPALGGITPRQAAADPTRRETLERLLRELELMNRRQPEAAITMRPWRLREMLGLT
jgi:hypothetical protein